MALRLEAMALRLEAIAFRLEASHRSWVGGHPSLFIKVKPSFAIRVEAIATRVEYMGVLEGDIEEVWSRLSSSCCPASQL